MAAVVDDFIGRFMNDPQFSRFLAGRGGESQRRSRQPIVDRLRADWGGPCVDIGRGMKTARAGLGTADNDRRLAVGRLVASLDKFTVPAKEKEELPSALDR
ncbi:MAG TPA: hypothetical protein VNL14_13605 [Candidatus Acidoferrales bacterium]|nr:hypothetical protein [Candidatus Acidoferrales bacterium]